MSVIEQVSSSSATWGDINIPVNRFLPTSMDTSTVLIGSILIAATAATIIYSRNPFASQNTQRMDHIGAGVLPYVVINNEVHFLLSKEGYRSVWCDFGGKRDRGETVLETAAREGWEESRDILGDREVVQRKISSAPAIGSKDYEMFFMKIEDPSAVTNEEFLKRSFSDHHRMEKTQIAWVTASDVFEAVQSENLLPGRLSSRCWSFFFGDKLRGCFAKTIYDALQNPRQREILEHVTKIDLQPLAKAS